jgi:hypothetical protein
MGSYPTFKDGHYATDLVLRCADASDLAAAREGLRRKLAAGGFHFITP